jgi:hypothetical protein
VSDLVESDPRPSDPPINFPGTAVSGRSDPVATIFLSYQSQDLEPAKLLKTALETKGHEVIIDMTGVVAGDDWRRVLMEKLQSADAMVVLLSE